MHIVTVKLRNVTLFSLIQRINVASRAHGMPYSKFMNGLKKANIALDRKQLSDIAIHDEAVFASLVKNQWQPWLSNRST